MQHVSSDKTIREVAANASQLLSDYYVDMSMRADVYSSVKAVYDRKTDLRYDAEDMRLLIKTEEDYRRNGLALPPHAQEEIKLISKKMSTLAIDFQTNLGEDDDGVWFTPEELDGVQLELSDSWTQRVENGMTERKMTFKYPDILPTTKYAKLEETRRKAWVAYENKCPENIEIMKTMMHLRKHFADLQGYPNYAEYVLEQRMAVNSSTVMHFLNELVEKLKPIGIEDLEKLKMLKLAEVPTAEEVQFKSWDHPYYARQLMEEEYNVDSAKVSEYFEMEHTINEMLKIYETLFSLSFNEVRGPDRDIWHVDVRQFAVWRTDTKEFQGWLYMDMYPRSGKYGHAASFELSPSYTDETGTRKYAVSALVCNFPKPTQFKPSLLKFDDVVTSFHELGHSIHALVSTTKWARFSGTSTARDFVEAPSTMLENWCYSKSILARISRHFETGKALPDELIDSIIKARHANEGLFNLRQIYLSLFDMKVHTDYAGTTGPELTKLWNEMRQEISFYDSTPYDPAGEASFAHIISGYEAGYYGYLWARVYSADMFHTKFEGRELDPIVGAEYRDKVLARGGSQDAGDLLRDFLGREPNNIAFLSSLGLT